MFQVAGAFSQESAHLMHDVDGGLRSRAPCHGLTERTGEVTHALPESINGSHAHVLKLHVALHPKQYSGSSSSSSSSPLVPVSM